MFSQSASQLASQGAPWVVVIEWFEKVVLVLIVRCCGEIDPSALVQFSEVRLAWTGRKRGSLACARATSPGHLRARVGQARRLASQFGSALQPARVQHPHPL